MLRIAILAGLLGAVLTASPAAAASTSVEAAGNAFTGGLAFAPAEVTVALGDEVRWTNTDFLAPHTATEDHGLWNLGGDYGATPVSAAGFAPGTTVMRTFEAGTQRYFCVVHPDDMKGVVRVAPQASVDRERRRSRIRGRRAATRYFVAGRWSTVAPADGLAFDVDRRKAGADWARWLTATREPTARFRAQRGATWELRVRLRRAGDEASATDFSPAVAVGVR